MPLSKKLCERNISWYRTCFSSRTASEQNNVISSVVSTSVWCLSWWLQPRLVFSCFFWYLEWYLTEYSALLPDPAKLQDFTLLNDVHAMLHNCYTVCHFNTLGVLISDLVLVCQTLVTSMICKLAIYRLHGQADQGQDWESGTQFQSLLYQWLAVWLWLSHLISLSQRPHL